MKMKEQYHKLRHNHHGYAIVEATIVFPIIIMIFTGLMLLASYLPQRAVLQYATQHAATAIASESGDTWLSYDADGLEYTRVNSKSDLDNVYASLLSSIFTSRKNSSAEDIVINQEKNSIHFASSELTVDCSVLNAVVYKEVSVSATSTFKAPVNLGFVGFPTEIPITVTSTAVVQNGDEFIRNMDIAADMIDFLMDKYDIDISGLTDKISEARSFLGI